MPNVKDSRVVVRIDTGFLLARHYGPINVPIWDLYIHITVTKIKVLNSNPEFGSRTVGVPRHSLYEAMLGSDSTGQLLLGPFITLGV